MQRFCRNEIVIADASRPISASEIAACAKANITSIELPVAYDGLAVVVNPANTWAESMTVAELKRLWEPGAQGKITRWNQVRASWPDREIHLFGPGVASGTFDYFNEVINGNSKASRGDYTSSEDDNVLVQGVSGDELALGYFGLAYYEQNKGRLKLVAIDDEHPDNGAGPIQPSFETVRAGTYRPLSRPLFVYVNVAALERPAVQQFVDFYLNAPNALIQRVGYVPLTDAESQLVRQRFGQRTAGTMFTHEPGAKPIPLEDRLKGGR
jgi:phosphate transport system substrate-binding protein